MSYLTRVALKNRWLTFALVAILVGASVWATINLKLELIPDIQPPILTVVAQSPQASPEEVMNEVTTPIENALQGMQGLQHIESTSMENLSFIILTFEYGINMDEAANEVNQRINEAGPDLETPPFVLPMSMEMVPVNMLSVAGAGMSTVELRGYAEENILPVIRQVEGLLPPEKETALTRAVDVLGGQESARVSLDIAGLNEAGIPPTWVIQTILAQEHFDSLESIEQMPLLGDPSLPPLDMFIDTNPPTYITRSDGEPSIAVLVYKDTEANTVEVGNAVADKVAEIEENLPPGMKIGVIFDQSEYIEQSISDLTREAVVGGILAAVVIFAFLWAVRPSLIVVLTIPLSIVISFLIMYFLDITLNLLTLSAMAIAIGRIVDDAIVVVEVIYRYLQQGEPFKVAALKGVREVAAPITSATIATVAIFIPLMFVGGLVGELFQPFALTVTFAMLVSLLVALTVVPALSSFITTKIISPSSSTGSVGGYVGFYRGSLSWALRHKTVVILIAVVFFVGSFGLLPIIGTSFLPPLAQPMLLVQVETAQADQIALDQKVQQVEEEMKVQGFPQFYTILGNPFTGMPMPMGEMAFVIALLDDDSDINRIASELKDGLSYLEDESTRITVSGGEALMETMVGTGSALTLRILGHDIEMVTQATSELSAAILDLEEEGLISNVSGTLALGGTRPVIAPDPEKMINLGLDPNIVAQELAILNYGYPVMFMGSDDEAEVPTVDINGKQFGVSISGVIGNLDDTEQLANIWIWGRSTPEPTQQPVRLGDIVATDITLGPALYARADGEYSGTVSANIIAEDVGSVNRRVTEAADAVESKYPGVIIQAGGVTEQMDTTFRDMGIAILAAIVISYFIMVIGTRSFLNALIIMVSLPLAFIGAFLGLLISGHTLGASALMGFLMLTGIVITNAIVLITRIEQLRPTAANMNEAIIEAGTIRLRPILMTALTTMLALVPLALGLESSVLLAAELAVVVIGGLFSSTVLTLIVVPVVYAATHRTGKNVKQ